MDRSAIVTVEPRHEMAVNMLDLLASRRAIIDGDGYGLGVNGGFHAINERVDAPEQLLASGFGRADNRRWCSVGTTKVWPGASGLASRNPTTVSSR